MITLSCHFFRSDLDMWTASKPIDVGLSLSMKCVLFPPAFCGSKHVIDHFMLTIHMSMIKTLLGTNCLLFQSVGLSLFHLGSFCELPLYVLPNIVSIYSYIYNYRVNDCPVVSDCSWVYDGSTALVHGLSDCL